MTGPIGESSQPGRVPANHEAGAKPLQGELISADADAGRDLGIHGASGVGELIAETDIQVRGEFTGLEQYQWLADITDSDIGQAIEKFRDKYITGQVSVSMDYWIGHGLDNMKQVIQIARKKANDDKHEFNDDIQKETAVVIASIKKAKELLVKQGAFARASGYKTPDGQKKNLVKALILLCAFTDHLAPREEYKNAASMHPFTEEFKFFISELAYAKQCREHNAERDAKEAQLNAQVDDVSKQLFD